MKALVLGFSCCSRSAMALWWRATSDFSSLGFAGALNDAIARSRAARYASSGETAAAAAGRRRAAPLVGPFSAPGLPAEALSEPTRRDIVLRLLRDGELPCQASGDFAPKTNLSYHFARLREAGVTRTRVAGPYRMISVRVDDLAARFPGLLDAIVAAARSHEAMPG